ncbi:MAG: hypothetical protein EPO07_17735 [Verrucomicrobia bacterium]|nr:MAG: hypothetical protein EPO07_17735 [Verrucomicrobiota bacterium]
MKNPLVGVWGNALLLGVNNLCPPVFATASWWNQHSIGLLPDVMSRPMTANFEQGFQMLWELPTEDWTGVGAGVSVLMIVSVFWSVAADVKRRSWPGATPFRLLTSAATQMPSLAFRLALISPWLALLAYCAKSGMVTPARLIAPYYPLLLPLLLVGAEQSALVRRSWWRGLAWLVFLAAFSVLIVTPARPLWPAQTILSRALAAKPGNRLIERGLKTYSVYSVRADPLAKIRERLPPDLKVVGFLGTEDDLDISLWKPYGSRHVEPIMLGDSAEDIRARKIQYAVVSEFQFQLANTSFDEWLARVPAEVLASETITVRVSTGPQKWFVVRFKD